MRVSSLSLLLLVTSVSAFCPPLSRTTTSSWTASTSDDYLDTLTPIDTDTDDEDQLDGTAFVQQMDQDQQAMEQHDFGIPSKSTVSTKPSLNVNEAAQRAVEAHAAMERRLNEAAFCLDMEEAKMEMDALMAKSFGSSSKNKVDIYDQATARLERLAAASMERYPMVSQTEIYQESTQKALESRRAVPDKTAAFVMLGVAMTAATVAQYPELMEQIQHLDISALQEQLGNIDLSVLKEQMENIDLSSLHLDAAVPAIHELLDQMTAQLSVMKDSILTQASHFTDSVQLEGVTTALAAAFHDLQTTVVTQLELAKENVLTADLSQQLDSFQESLVAQTIAIQETLAAQTSALQDSVLPDLQATLQDTLESSKFAVQQSLDQVGTTLNGALTNLQYQDFGLAATSAVHNLQASMDTSLQAFQTQALPSAQSSLGSVTASLESTLHDAQGAAQGGMETVQAQLPGVMTNVQQAVGGLKESASGLQTAMDVQVGDLKESLPGYTSTAQSQLAAMTAGLSNTLEHAQVAAKEGVDTVQNQLPGVVSNVQQAVETQVGGLKESFPEYTSTAQSNLASMSAGVQTTLEHAQGAAKGGVDAVQSQLPGVVSNVQQAVDGLKESASGLQTVVDAQVGGLKESLPGKMDSLSTGVMGQVAAVQDSVQSKAASFNMPKFNIEDTIARATDTLSASAPKMNAIVDKLDSVQETIKSKAPDMNEMTAHAKGASSAIREQLNSVPKMEMPKIDVSNAASKVVADVSAPFAAAAKDVSNFDVFGSSSADIENFFKSH